MMSLRDNKSTILMLKENPEIKEFKAIPTVICST
jgi:hypothetical protein